jgi:cysteine synthase A
LFVGSSSALNIVATVKAAKKMKKKSRLVTVICDSGTRHLSRFWNKEYVKNKYNLNCDDEKLIPDCLLEYY